jgi:hypothetical protein
MACIFVVTGTCASATSKAVVLAPHRAVYDVSLAESRTAAGIVAVDGRMVYELTGSACEGYTEKMRFVTQMTNQDGEKTITDQRTSNWEEGSAKRFHFATSEARDGKATEDTAGDVVRAGTTEGASVALTKPANKTFSLAPGVYFPVEHTIALLTAARNGKALFRADIYDGSENGDKVYNTTSAIGAMLPPGGKKQRTAHDVQHLEKLTAWPISIAYFDSRSDDAVPLYEMKSVFFENGVNSDFFLDYGSFALSGKLKEIAFLEPSKCE